MSCRLPTSEEFAQTISIGLKMGTGTGGLDNKLPEAIE